MFWVGEVWRRGGSSWGGWETITMRKRVANAVVITFESAEALRRSQSGYSGESIYKP